MWEDGWGSRYHLELAELSHEASYGARRSRDTDHAVGGGAEDLVHPVPRREADDGRAPVMSGRG